MGRFLMTAVALCLLATPALAARKVYLKEGGEITARKVWRSEGKVHVLINRDTLVDFSTSELDMKRTFSRSGSDARTRKKTGKVLNSAAVPVGAVEPRKAAEASAAKPIQPKQAEKPGAPLPAK